MIIKAHSFDESEIGIIIREGRNYCTKPFQIIFFVYPCGLSGLNEGPHIVAKNQINLLEFH